MLKAIFNIMKELIPTLKTTLKEPRIYALVMNSAEGGILHLGIHNSLDEAIEATHPAVHEAGGPLNGGVPQVEMWTALDGAEVIRAMVDFKPMKTSPAKKKVGLPKASKAKEVPVRAKTTKDHIDILKKTKT